MVKSSSTTSSSDNIIVKPIARLNADWAFKSRCAAVLDDFRVKCLREMDRNALRICTNDKQRKKIGLFQTFLFIMF